MREFVPAAKARLKIQGATQCGCWACEPDPAPFAHTCLQEFDSKNWTVFTPHYIVWICPTPYRAR